MWRDFMQMGTPAAMVLMAVCGVPVALVWAASLASYKRRSLELGHTESMRKLDLDQKVITHNPKPSRSPDYEE